LALLPQTELLVLEYSSFDGNLRLLVGEQEYVLGPSVTGRIFVEIL
jgi:hypothetical protein